MKTPTATGYLDFQFDVYRRGLDDLKPGQAFDHVELEAQARTLIGPRLYGWIAGAAGSEATLRANREAFDRWTIVPRMLRDLSARELDVEVLGLRLRSPLMLAPIGVHSLVHPNGELAVGRAAAGAGVPLIASTASSYTMEEIGAAMGDAPRWFQCYWPNDVELGRSFLRRAEAAGFSAIVLTLDTPFLAWRPRDLAAGYLPFLRGVGIANYLQDPVFRSQLARPPEEDMDAAVALWAARYSDPAHSWDMLTDVRESTTLPILLKGIQHADDARAAAAHGMDGVVVSNHGGRQVDGAVGSLDMLPEIVDAVPDGYPVLFDSGIRTGADVFKAVALGADAVLVGRPYMWGLSLAGERGVRQVIDGLLAETELTFALSGHPSIHQARDGGVRHVRR